MRFNEPPLGAGAMRLRSELFGQARRLVRCPHDAEDIVQDVSIRVCFSDRLDPDRAPAEQHEYLRRALLWEISGRSRRRNRRCVSLTEADAQSLEADDDGPLSRIKIDEQLSRIHAFASTLPKALRDVFSARLVRGLTIDEAADELECDPATIKRRQRITIQILAARCDTDSPCSRASV